MTSHAFIAYPTKSLQWPGCVLSRAIFYAGKHGACSIEPCVFVEVFFSRVRCSVNNFTETDRQTESSDVGKHQEEGLAVASIARDVIVEMTLPATTLRGKFGSEFET